VLCVPGERARIHRVTIPTTNRKRLLGALHYALEDQLLHDVANYHLVPLWSDRVVTGISVIVTEHQYINGLLHTCSASGWNVLLLVPDYLTIAAPASSVWFIDASATPLLLRKSGADGAVLHGEFGAEIPGMLLLALEQADKPPEKLVVRVCNREQYKTITDWSAQLASRNIQLEIMLDNSTRGQWLARQPLPEPGLTLLTGPYTVVDRQIRDLRRIRPVAAMLGVLVTLSLVHWLVTGSRLQDEHDQLQQSVTAMYMQAFPDTKNLVDPRFQMEQQLQQLARGNADAKGGQDFLARLQDIAEQLDASPGSQLYRVSFDGSSITVEVSVPDYEALDRLQQQFAAGATVNIENAELKNGRVFGRIRLGGQA
jgi:general secretion pathway protein L